MIINEFYEGDAFQVVETGNIIFFYKDRIWFTNHNRHYVYDPFTFVICSYIKMPNVTVWPGSGILPYGKEEFKGLISIYDITRREV